MSSNRSSETMGRPPAEDHSSAIVTSSPDESGEERPTPPSLYFDVDKAKENKYTSYAELRKKHRERWTPPNMPSSSPSRSEQVCKVSLLSSFCGIADDRHQNIKITRERTLRRQRKRH